MGGNVNSHSPVSDEFDEWIERFEQAWEAAEPPDIGTFLASLAGRKSDESSWRQLLVELVSVDLEYRWRRYGSEVQETVTYRREDVDGAPALPLLPRLENYVDRFPELGSPASLPLELVVDEFRARHYWGDRPPVRGYVVRFAHLRDQLDNVLSEVLAEVTPLTLRVYCSGQLAHATRLVKSMEIGRQQAGEPPPYSEFVSDGGGRLIIAPIHETKISRRHVCLERIKPDVVRVISRTTKGDIGLGTRGHSRAGHKSERLAPGRSAEVELPTLLVLGQYAIRVEPISSTGSWPGADRRHPVR